MENELDRVNEYLSMAKANMETMLELCETRYSSISPNINNIDEKVIDYLNKDLPKIDAKIEAAKDLIEKFKRYYYLIQE